MPTTSYCLRLPVDLMLQLDDLAIARNTTKARLIAEACRNLVNTPIGVTPPPEWKAISKHNKQAKTLRDLKSYPAVANNGVLANVPRTSLDLVSNGKGKIGHEAIRPAPANYYVPAKYRKDKSKV
jgi:hypothetical protein